MQTLSYTPDHLCLAIRIKANREHVHTILEEIYKTIAPTHKEEGCLEYRLFHEDDAILIWGKWKNKMALDLHLLLQFHIQLLEVTLPPLCKKITIQSYKEVEPPITALSLG